MRPGLLQRLHRSSDQAVKHEELRPTHEMHGEVIGSRAPMRTRIPDFKCNSSDLERASQPKNRRTGVLDVTSRGRSEWTQVENREFLPGQPPDY